jgi:hypothetical protein
MLAASVSFCSHWQRVVEVSWAAENHKSVISTVSVATRYVADDIRDVISINACVCVRRGAQHCDNIADVQARSMKAILYNALTIWRVRVVMFGSNLLV